MYDNNPRGIVARNPEHPDKFTVCCGECGETLLTGAESLDGANYILKKHYAESHDTASSQFGEQKFDMVDHPEHYTKGSLECIDWIRIFLTEEEYHGYLKGTVLKYLWRHEDKGNPIQDLEKLRKYAEFLIDQFEREETERDILEENKRAGTWAATKKTRRIMRGEDISPVVKFIDEKLAELEDKEEN